MPFLILLFTGYASFGDGLEKGFERLKVFDYFQAKGEFEKALKKRPAGAAYGLSLIYASNDNPFYNLDSARVYILLADSLLPASTPKQLAAYQELDITSSGISRQKDIICQRAFLAIEKSSSVTQFNRYLTLFHFCPAIPEALALRNQAAFRDARKEGTSLAFKAFMSQYPEADEWKEAKAMYEERLFEEITETKTVASFRSYLSQFPEGSYKQQAERMIYKLSVVHAAEEEYAEFIRLNPTNSYVQEAWRALYRVFMKEFNEQTYQGFRKKYPNYPFMEELEEDYKLMNALLIPFRKNNLWGYINDQGKEIIKAIYEEAGQFSEGYAVVKMKGKFGYINKAAKLVIPCDFDDAEAFQNKTAVVGKNELYGLIGRSGEILIPLEYEDLSDPVEDICIGIIDERSYYIHKTGTKVSPDAYEFAGEFQEGFAIFGTDELVGLLNKKGQVTLEPAYEQLFNEGNGLFRAKRKERWGVVTASGEIKVPFEYDLIAAFSEGKALVVKGLKCGFITETGKKLIPLSMTYTENLINSARFRNGYVLVKQKQRHILFDSTGSKINTTAFEDIGMPSEGLMAVRKNKKWGYASLSGKIKIPVKFQQAGPFINGLAKIQEKNKFGIIDTTGRIVVPVQYDEISMERNCFLIKKNNYWGLKSLPGELLLLHDYERIEVIQDNVAIAIKDSRKTYLNLRNGQVILKEN